MKKTLIAMLALAMILSLFACTADTPSDGQSGTALDAIKASGKLILGTEAQYAPYEFKLSDGTIVGFDIDLANYIAEKLGVTLEIRDMSFDGLLPDLQTGNVDIVIAGMTPDAKRREAVDFSMIYYRAEQGMVVRAEDADKYQEIDELAGSKLGAQKGSIQQEILNGLEGVEKLSLDKVPLLVGELKMKNIDGVIMELPVAKNYVSNNADLAVSPIRFAQSEDESGSAIAVQKGKGDLVSFLNECIAEAQEEGLMDQWVVAANELAGTVEE